MPSITEPRFGIRLIDHTVALEQRIGQMTIIFQHVQAENDVAAGEVAQSFMATPHHWTVYRSVEE